ncbi:hypothetical protein Ntsu_41230 [Nocardia sp. IFM 10818]
MTLAMEHGIATLAHIDPEQVPHEAFLDSLTLFNRAFSALARTETRAPGPAGAPAPEPGRGIEHSPRPPDPTPAAAPDPAHGCTQWRRSRRNVTASASADSPSGWAALSLKNCTKPCSEPG